MVPEQEYDVNRDLTFLTTLVKASPAIGEMTPLSPGFVPGPHDCICGRGKKSFHHIGNQRFRIIVSNHLQKYSSATTKLEKSLLVSTIVDTVRDNSPKGGFVKFAESTGMWHEVGDHLAREKVGQAFRDYLHTKYRSSTTFKKKKRTANKAKNSKACQIDLSKSKGVIISKIQELSEVVARGVSDEILAELFNKINLDLLDEIHVMTKLGSQSCERIVASCQKMCRIEDVQPCESSIAPCNKICHAVDVMDFRNDVLCNGSQSCESIISSCNKMSEMEEILDFRNDSSYNGSQSVEGIFASCNKMWEVEDVLDFRNDASHYGTSLSYSNEMINISLPMQLQY
mmetsp:Transcript_27797/g.36240  ORF Transcript_27797/g.36240 Transcript_27797/m.36240 type:complete len:342 (+) Transcript_27797:60-1085(+)